MTNKQTFHQTFGLKPVIRRCLCSQQDAAERAHRHVDENKKRTFGEMFVGVVKQIQHFAQQRKKNLFLTQIKLHPTLPNKCYETKQGDQTGPTLHQTFHQTLSAPDSISFASLGRMKEYVVSFNGTFSWIIIIICF